MCSTPDRPLGRTLRTLTAAAAAALACAAFAGCQRAYVERPEPLQPEPILEDDAMRLRQWAQASATYPNGSVDAGPTGFTWEPRRGQAEYQYYYGDAGVFLANVFVMPYRFFRTPPWDTLTYRGVWIEPTYHAMPALPPEPVMPAARVEELPAPPAPPEVPTPAEAAPPGPVAPPEAPATQPG